MSHIEARIGRALNSLGAGDVESVTLLSAQMRQYKVMLKELKIEDKLDNFGIRVTLDSAVRGPRSLRIVVPVEWIEGDVDYLRTLGNEDAVEDVLRSHAADEYLDLKAIYQEITTSRAPEMDIHTLSETLTRMTVNGMLDRKYCEVMLNGEPIPGVYHTVFQMTAIPF